MKTQILKGKDYDLLIFYCPGCQRIHPFTLNSKTRPNWIWNGNLEKPTLTPSLLCEPSVPQNRCHLFLRDGVIKFLDDCWHELKGQSIPLQELPEEYT